MCIYIITQRCVIYTIINVNEWLCVNFFYATHFKNIFLFQIKTIKCYQNKIYRNGFEKYVAYQILYPKPIYEITNIIQQHVFDY